MTTATATRKVAPRAQVAAVKAAHAEQITAENLAEWTTVFAVAECDRCGGTGSMPFAVDGGRCFKCGRAGRVYTRAASKSRALLDEKRDEVYGVPASEIKVGDRIHWRNNNGTRTWRTVTEVMADSGSASIVNSERIPYMGLRAKGSETLHCVHADSLIRRHNVEGAVAVVRLAATLDGVQVTRRAA